jgi:Rrf2 family protein
MGNANSGRRPDLKRRRQVAELRAQGLSLAEIGRRLGIRREAAGARLRKTGLTGERGGAVALETPMKLSLPTAQALVALAHLARQPRDLLVPAGRIAQAERLPLQPLSLALMRLSRAGVLAATPSRHGGYRLARPAGDISLLEVLEVLDGPLQGGAVVLGGYGDDALDRRLAAVGRRVTDAVREHLRRLSLTDLIGPKKRRR